jgi:ribose transport system permease protein
MAVAFSPRVEGQNAFLSATNLVNVLRQVSETGILAVGMTLVILTGGIDLSVGSVVAFAATLGALLLAPGDLRESAPALLQPLLTQSWPALAAVPVVLTVGAGLGAAQGLVITRGRIQAFVVTLAGMAVFRGLARYLSDGNSIGLTFGRGPGEADPAFGWLGARILNEQLPVPVLILLATVALVHVWLSRSRVGRHVYAIGGSEQATRLSGVNVNGVKTLVYTLSALLATLAGLIHAAQQSQGSPNDAVGYELSAIAAAVIGGASLSGGIGTITGTLAGTLVIGIIDNFLALRQVNPHLRLVLSGLIIVAAVLLQRRSRE